MPWLTPLVLLLAGCPSPVDDTGDVNNDTDTMDVDTDTTDTDTDTDVVADGSCAAPFPVGVGTTLLSTGGNDVAPSCARASSGDVVATFTAPSAGWWRLSTQGSSVDTVLAITDDCTDPSAERACHDNYLPDTHAVTHVQLDAEQSVHVLVSRAYGQFPADVSLSIVAEAPPQVPELTAVNAICTDGGDRIGLDLQATGTALRQVHLTPLASGTPLTCTPDTAPYDTSLSIACADSLAGITDVEVVVVDALGQASIAVADACSIPGIVGIGAACGADAGFAQCGEGMCLQGVCTVVTPPVLDGAVAVYAADTERLGVQVIGSDAEADVAAIRLTFLDATGNVIQVDGPFGQVPYPPSDLGVEAPSDDLALTATAALPPSLPTANLFAVDVQLLDRAGLLSEPVRAVLDAPSDLFDGAICDVSETLDRCPDVCLPTDLTGTGTCSERDITCPTGVTPQILTDTLTIDITGTAPTVLPPTCVIATPQAVLSFTAPDPGTYTFTIEPELGDALASLALRTACSLPTPDEELACTTPGTVSGGVQARLSAGSEVFLVVSGRSTLSPDGALGRAVVTVSPESN